MTHVGPEVGYGVVATQRIPKGTLTYVKDAQEAVFPTAHPIRRDPEFSAYIEKYAYEEANGDMIVSWDHGKFVNHCCHFNSISTGYGFEIAIRDIEAGEQLTDNYALFNLKEEMELICRYSDCLKRIGLDLIRHELPRWDEWIKEALEQAKSVRQPLWPYLHPLTIKRLTAYFQGEETYTSVGILLNSQEVFSENGQDK